MRVRTLVTARALGLMGVRHVFGCGGRPVAWLAEAGRAGRAQVTLAGGAVYDMLPLGRGRRLLWQGERELGQGTSRRWARSAELVYGAVPYFLVPAGWSGRYRLVNEADAEVLTIAFRSPLRRKAALSPQAALDLILVVFAYQMARRLL